jgi:phosphoribosylglycinamide formyltransferase-1
MNIGVLASHEGTTLQGLLDACADGRIPARVTVVIGNNSDAGALRRARDAGVRFVVETLGQMATGAIRLPPG